MQTKLKYVDQYVDRHGKTRSYYRRNGQRQTIDGVSGSAEWLESYARIHKSFEHPPSPATDHETLGYAVQDYLDSSRYRGLADSTQRSYRVALERVIEKIGHHKLSEFTRGNIVQIRDQIAKRSKTMARLTVVTLSLVFEHARDFDLVDRNPAKGVRSPRGHVMKPHRKWTFEEIDAIYRCSDPFARRYMMVLLYTGLRCSDAVRLQRGWIKSGMIDLRTKKTDTQVVIPLHASLKAELAKNLPIESVYFMPGRYGKSPSVGAVRELFNRNFAQLGIEDSPTTHGLRKNAITSLVEAGCVPREIQSITGQSLNMIEHYASEYDRRALAKKAIIKWEEHSTNE